MSNEHTHAASTHPADASKNRDAIDTSDASAALVEMMAVVLREMVEPEKAAELAEKAVSVAAHGTPVAVLRDFIAAADAAQASAEGEAFEAWYARRYGYDFSAPQETWKHAAMCDALEVWCAALAQRPALVALTREQKLTLAGNYFSEPWVIQYAIDLMHDYEQMVGITAPKAQEGE